MDQRQIGTKTVSAARTDKGETGSFVGGSDLQHSTMDPAKLADQIGAGQNLNRRSKMKWNQEKPWQMATGSVQNGGAKEIPVGIKNLVH